MLLATFIYNIFYLTDVESGVKWRVPKLLLEFSMRQLHNEIIDSPDYGGLLVVRHANTNDVIISDTMLCSLEHPQLRPLIDHQKMMWVVLFATLQSIFKNR